MSCIFGETIHKNCFGGFRSLIQTDLCIAHWVGSKRDLNKLTEIVIKKQITNEAIATFDDRIFLYDLKKLKDLKIMHKKSELIMKV